MRPSRITRKVLTPEQALQKVRHFCAYQERSHQEVREKLYSLGLKKTEVEQSLSTLIEEDYLNEERFARLYAGGKFRQKQWGREKIIYALKEKRVSQYSINQALLEIKEEEYMETAATLARKKWETLGEYDLYERTGRVRQFLQQRGFEYAIAKAVTEKMEQ